MPAIELKPLPPHMQALAARAAEVMRGMKPGETRTIPADLAAEINAAIREETAPQILEIRKRERWGGRIHG